MFGRKSCFRTVADGFPLNRRRNVCWEEKPVRSARDNCISQQGEIVSMIDYSDFLLTVDFDRTLTAPDSTIPKRNIEAIEYFMANGGTFTVNTGRSIPSSMGAVIPDVPVNAPLLLYNGSAAYDKAAKRFTRTGTIDLPVEVVLELQAAFPDLRIEIQGSEAHYLFSRDAVWQEYCAHNGMPWAYCAPKEIPGPFLKFSIYGRFKDETVASMYEATEAELARIAEAIAYVEHHWGDKVDVFRACHQIADIHAKGCSKLNSARLLQKELGKKWLVCVGDAENDLSMLEGADFAFCPADGVVADRFENVCDCAQGAVADVIYKKIPEILAKQP